MNGHAACVAETDVSAERTLWDLVSHWANRQPQKDFLIYLQDQNRPQDILRLTWGQLATAVWEMRQRLLALGVADQRVVILALPNSPFSIVAWLAIAANGGVMQAVDPDSGILPLANAIRTTQPVALIGCRGNAAALAKALSESQLSAALVIADDLDLSRPLARIEGLDKIAPGEPCSATADLVAGMLPTSGTSGTSKLVEFTQRNYVIAGERQARNSGHGPDDRLYLCTPFFHVNAQMYLCMPALVAGASIAAVPQFSATRYFDSARATGATAASMVAPAMRMALHKAHEEGHAQDPGLRLIQYGMSMSEADWKLWDQLFPNIAMRQVYGQTESVSTVLGDAPWEVDDRRTIGRPFLGVDAVRLVAEHGQPVQDGEQGELLVRGAPGRTLMRGYYNNAAATAATLDADGWLHTGDLMRRNADGRFAFIGRKMHVVRRAGENISTYELELMMQSCPLIADVAIKAEADAILDSRLVAHVIPAPGFSEQAFTKWCREAIGKRGVADAIKVHQDFPRTPSGRVILRDLS